MSNTDHFIAKSKRYTDITELTPELLRLFIQKIVVHEKSAKYSKHAEQTVEIHYTDIGYISGDTQQNQESPGRKSQCDSCRGIPPIEDTPMRMRPSVISFRAGKCVRVEGDSPASEIDYRRRGYPARPCSDRLPGAAAPQTG